MRKTKPNCNTLAGKGAFKVVGDGFTESSCNVRPVHVCHKGSYQDSSRVDDIASWILIITIVGARSDVAAGDLRVYVVATDPLKSEYIY
jgi:hypothetical protein